jgi:hypothetical protein
MANPYPFRLEALRRLTTLLETIRIADGYLHDMQGRVFRGRILYGEKDPVPMIALVEPPVPVDPFRTPEDAPAGSIIWEMMVQAFVKDDPLNPTDPAHMLLADVRKCLWTHKSTKHVDRGFLSFGQYTNTVTDMIIGDPKVRPSDEVSAKAYFWLPLSLVVVETPGDPLNYS